MNIDFLLEAVKEDPQTYRDLAKFARDNPRPKTNPVVARFAAEQARKDAHKGAAADSRDIKRVSDYDKVGGITTSKPFAQAVITRSTNGTLKTN